MSAFWQRPDLKEESMDYGKAVKYMFDDKDWLKKILIGGVLNIIPVVNFIPVGYGLRTLKAVGEGRDTPLPEWDDWGGDFMKGLLVAVAGLVYAIPIIVLAILSAIVTAIATSGSSGSSETAGGIATLCLSGITCLNVLWGIAMALFLPSAILKFVKAGEFGAFFRFGEIWDFIKSNLGDYIVALLVAWLAAVVASVVGSIACGIGVLFTGFWATLVAANLFGQLLAKSMPAAPVPPASPFGSYGEPSGGAPAGQV
jgi:hypothetical protein